MAADWETRGADWTADVAVVFFLQLAREARDVRVERVNKLLTGACGACGVVRAPFDRRKILPCSSRREKSDGMLKIDF